MNPKAASELNQSAAIAERERVFELFRRWGYLEAELDPLGFWRPEPHAELAALAGEAAEAARRLYAGTLAAEFMHIPDPERRRWVQERMEGEAPSFDRERILELLIRAEIFEQVLQSRYLGTKRFSLEGLGALLPLLDAALDDAGELGAEWCVLAMSHRGRLNVMVHIAGKDARDVYVGFEDVDPRSVLGSGDVKYHRGATGDFRTRRGRTVRVHLVSNPSHLEAVDPVALGRARAKQRRLGKDGHRKVLPITLHGDAAFAGQGILSESLALGGLKGFQVGGTVHLIVNNLIGFTTPPPELHPTRFASDAARRVPIPIFHVNAEDVDAVVRAAQMAVEYRYAFGSDVVVDLVGFRRHGHSEVDDPSITQPLLYRRIEQHPPVWQVYAQKTGMEATARAARIRAEYEAAQREAEQLEKKPPLYQLPDYWAGFVGGAYDPAYEVDTGLAAGALLALAERLTTAPEGFHVHPKVQRLLEERARMGRGEKPVDFAMAEALALASLLKQGIPVRFSGQDTRRGTFNQRHAALVDTETGREYLPLEHLDPQQARCELHNSMLSEAAVLGFEYGYARDYPDALVLWEAQFGDFANNAQVIIDQFISAGEDKWGLLAGLVVLLPHGFEGQGPEHSSARLERFLQLAAEDNFQVCQPSSAAQYFHLLRRQALRRWRKPLIVFTPKSMLRHPEAASKLEELARPRFLPVVPEREVTGATRLLVSTGKIGHELRMERRRRKDDSVGIVFLDQLYPFPESELAAELDSQTAAREFVWVQEEPANMGALFYVLPWLERLSGGRPVRSIKRSASASPATGSAKAHELEQKALLNLAFARHGKT
jgi:2-oxoglutarate dehydrogenase E1 component